MILPLLTTCFAMESAACGVGRGAHAPTAKQRSPEERDGCAYDRFPFPKDALKHKCSHLHGYYAAAAPYSKKSPWNNYRWNYYHGGSYFHEPWAQWGASSAALPSCEYNTQASTNNYQRWARCQQQQQQRRSFPLAASPQEEMRTMQQAAAAAASSRSSSQFPCYIPPPLLPLHDVADANYPGGDPVVKMPPPLLPLPGIGFDPAAKTTAQPATYPHAHPKAFAEQPPLPARLPPHSSLKDGAATYQYPVGKNHTSSAFPHWTPEIRSVEPPVQQQCKSPPTLYRRPVAMPTTPWVGQSQSTQPSLPSLVPLPGTASQATQQHPYYPSGGPRQCTWNSHINLHYPSDDTTTNTRPQGQMTPYQYSDYIPCNNPFYSDIK